MFEPKQFENLLGLEGFSDQMLTNHFTLYQGYVTNTNKLLEELTALTHEGKTATPQYAELKRRFGWEFNGMRLHELYFGNMAKESEPLKSDAALAKKIAEDFGSHEAWEKDFRAAGAMRGIGWVVLSYDPVGDRLMNIWVNEHDGGHLAGCRPVLVMDVFEHAYMLDYGLKRADYIEAFMHAIEWQTASDRLQVAQQCK